MNAFLLPRLSKRRVVQRLLRLLFRWLTRVEVTGLEHIPRQGRAILATNHLSRLDPPLIFVVVDREDLTALAAKKYRRVPLLRQLLEAADVIWLDRSAPDAKALRQALAHLRRGGLLGIAPEGTRSPTQALQRGKPGVAYLAAMAEAPVIPVAIWGTEGWYRHWLRLRRPRLRVRIGPPLRLGPMPRQGRDQWLQERTDQIMAHIAALLPPPYRGVYARHPLLSAPSAPPQEESP